MNGTITDYYDYPTIPEYDVDPADPSPGDNWVLVTRQGTPIGLLLAITKELDTYQFSFRTLENTTVRVTMS